MRPEPALVPTGFQIVTVLLISHSPPAITPISVKQTKMKTEKFINSSFSAYTKMRINQKYRKSKYRKLNFFSFFCPNIN